MTPSTYTALRAEILAVLRDDLGVDPPDPATDLITAGLLDSLAIVAMLVTLEQRFAVQIQLDALDLDSVRTVERIEALIEASLAGVGEDVETAGMPMTVCRGQAAPASRITVTLRGGVGRPCFLVHDSYAAAFTAQPIAAVLTTERPLVGLQARGFETADAPQHTVEEMAETYVEAIRAVQPEGPYSLAGNSFGGLIAYEMARILRRDGETVDVLAMIDTQASSRALSGWRYARHRLRQPLRLVGFIRADPRARLPLYVRKFLGRVVPRLVTPPPLYRPLPPHVERLKRIADAAESAYRPPSYDGTAMLFVARSRPPGKTDPPDVWIPRVRGPLELIGMPGEHGELAAESLAVVGAELSRVLAA